MLARIAGALLGAVVLLAGLYLLFVFNWTYSSGERAGWVQKISRKGWVCKTWEGELAMAAIPGSIPEKFEFTVRDDAVAGKINLAAGQRARLHYEQHRGLPGTCFGETGYWVDGITLIDAPAQSALPVTPAAAGAAAPPAAPAASVPSGAPPAPAPAGPEAAPPPAPTAPSTPAYIHTPAPGGPVHP